MTPVELITTNVAPQATLGDGSRASLEKAAKDFEAVFMSQMLKPMWEGMETDPMFGGGPGEDAFRDMLVQEYGKSMATVDNFGLSHAVMDEMVRLQEKMDLKS